MSGVFLNALMPLLVGAMAVYLWHRRRTRMKWSKRRGDYLWAFVHAGVFYVMFVIIVMHLALDMSFAQILSTLQHFGELQITIAFLSAAFEAAMALLDLWSGDGIPPALG